MAFAYLFARFPSLTQTFCFREVEELRRQMGPMPIWSLRYPRDFSLDCPETLASATRYLPEQDELRKQVGSLRSMIFRYPWHVIWALKRWGNRQGKYRLFEAAWLGRELKAQGVNHIHTHFAGTSARTAWWIQQFYGITYSFTGHANDMFCVNEDPLPLGRLVSDAVFVVTVSDFSRQWLCQQFPLNTEKIHRVYNGMALKPPCKAVAAQDVPLIVSVGRAIEKKGFGDLIAACSILRAEGVSFSCQIIGGGPLESVLRDQISLLGLADCIELKGALPLDEVQDTLRHASLFVLPCVTEADGGMDNLPTVILEAMEAELPVISTRLAAVPEMVEEGVTGLLVEERHPHALAEAMTTLLCDSDLRQRMGAAGRALAGERFAVEGTVAQLLSLVQEVVGSPGLE